MIPQHKFDAIRKGGGWRNERLISLVLLALLLLIASCAKPYNPFVIERGKILKQVSTIAVFPMRIPFRGERFKAIEKEFEGLIETKLKEGGFNIVSAETIRKFIEPKEAEAGGMYDPATGELIKEKFRKIIGEAINNVTIRNNADALLFPAAIATSARWKGNTAKWHGVEEPTSGEGGFIASWRLSNVSGRISALSLRVTLTDKSERPLYINFGGIQLMAWMRPGEGFVKVPQDQIFTDPEKTSKAVEIALTPLITEQLPVATARNAPRAASGAHWARLAAN